MMSTRNMYRSPSPDFTRELGKGPPMVPVGVDRTPCPRCGVRADVGCPHAVPSWVWAIADITRIGGWAK